MRNIKRLALVSLLVLGASALVGCQKTASEWSAEPANSLGGFNVPMGALVDKDGTVYVSNIQTDQENGYWTADAAGFISRLAPGGQLTNLYWANSNPTMFLNAPKGMCILDGELYVADINRIIRYRLEDPNQGADVALDHGRTLVDVTTDGKRVFVSDGSSARLYRIEPKSMQISSVPAPARVAGITFYDGAVYATSIQDHEVYRIDPEGRIPPVPLGLSNYFQQPCSLVVLSDGTLVVADYDAGSLMTIAPDRIRVSELAKVDSPGIIGLDVKRNLLYVPQMKTNQVRIFQLSPHPMSGPREQPPEVVEPAAPHPAPTATQALLAPPPGGFPSAQSAPMPPPPQPRPIPPPTAGPAQTLPPPTLIEPSAPAVPPAQPAIGPPQPKRPPVATAPAAPTPSPNVPVPPMTVPPEDESSRETGKTR